MKRLLLLSAMTLPVWGQPTKLTLAEAEAIAAKNNPQVSIALMNAAAANQITIEMRSGFLPSVNGSVTGVGAIPNSSVGAGALSNSAIYSRLAAGITVSQLIADFGRTANLTASARLHAEARDISAKATRADVLLQVDQAYYAALRAASVLTVAQQTVQARQLVVDQVTALASANLKSGLDVSFAQVNLSDAKLLLVSAQNNIKSAYADLSNALGYRDQREFDLTETASPGAPPTDVQPLIQQSLEQRPEIRSARRDFLGARKFTEAEKDLKRPTINALATAGVIPEHADELHDRYAAAGVNVNVPIFNGRLFTARQTEAEYRAQAAEQNLRAIENRISRDVDVAYLNAVTAYQRLTLTSELLDQARQALELAQARYDLGLSSIVELSQAQLNLTSAQIANAGAKFEYGLQTTVLNYQAGVVK